MTVYTTIDSPLGELLLVGEETGAAVVLSALSIAGGKRTGVREGWVERPEAFAEIIAQLRAYFAGERTDFDIEYHGVGSDFQRRVWQALDEIPYGSTATYGQIAARIGAPREAVRAVGAAIGANPLMIVRPCHRVIGANGSLTGYAGGVERKRQLLELESVG
ncbi:methylated-DNA--[protein]-cysteine S-methyltransferase [Nocardia pseudobrasiliensis]|uniref:Methylated-DNA--protein-cysteine methyltransferase n=1 Tax=Nocardia pseudobrasiliensis TaxID=45979 RepID=A0A370HWM0_9NOCA|nr:methylated-DNA--[protein]-cysteine S-methyltransferase [Nocardia pseudobrasiliensis]RDI62913.1 methylated-DNA-[protein]-cysteine S-methyltransferase [Nocardia pseudobrasiliensis]